RSPDRRRRVATGIGAGSSTGTAEPTADSVRSASEFTGSPSQDIAGAARPTGRVPVDQETAADQDTDYAWRPDRSPPGGVPPLTRVPRPGPARREKRSRRVPEPRRAAGAVAGRSRIRLGGDG